MRALAIVATVVALAAGPVEAGAAVPASKQALVVLRVLAYDRALDERARHQVRIAVVHGPDADSLACAGRMRGVFDELVGRVAVTGKPIGVDTIAASAVSSELLSRLEISVAYVCQGADEDLARIVRAARGARVLTFSDQRDYLGRGLSIALVDGASRITLSINLEAARAEGARLDGQLLKLSEVVKR